MTSDCSLSTLHKPFVLHPERICEDNGFLIKLVLAELENASIPTINSSKEKQTLPNISCGSTNSIIHVSPYELTKGHTAFF